MPPSSVRHILLQADGEFLPEDIAPACISVMRQLQESGICGRFPIIVDAGPLSLEHWKTIHELGATGVRLLMNFWEPEAFAASSPLKALSGMRDRYLDSMKDALSVFGRGHVLCLFRVGAGMPGGSPEKVQEQCIRSSIQAAETLIPLGIQPRFAIERILTPQGLITPISMRSFLRLNLAEARLRREFGMMMNDTFAGPLCAPCTLEPDMDAWAAPSQGVQSL